MSQKQPWEDAEQSFVNVTQDTVVMYPRHGKNNGAMATTQTDQIRDNFTELLKQLKPVEDVTKQMSDDIGSFIASLQPVEDSINGALNAPDIPAPVHVDMQKLMDNMLEIIDYLESAESHLQDARKQLRDARKTI